MADDSPVNEAGYAPMPEMPRDFPPGQVVKVITVKLTRHIAAKCGVPDLYDQYYRENVARGIHRPAASTRACRQCVYQLWETHKNVVLAALNASRATTPAEILDYVKATGKTCAYDEQLRWVAENVVVAWDDIDPDDIPDPKCVNMLVGAQEETDKFWNRFHSHNTKAKADQDGDERAERRADERSTANLIRDFERALAAGVTSVPEPHS